MCNILMSPILDLKFRLSVIVGNPKSQKKILLAFSSTFWHPC